ncbi:MAG TPA: DUF554 domain-containing protein [Candidatus Cloacimonadota bacterium]|nr:DUF554 domain-containing protein [Candidatus Cloacimonadota bacterium]
MIGTLVNVGTVIIGSIIGVILRARFSKRFTEVAFQGIGLFTIFLGVMMALKSEAYLIIILSVISGSLIGEALNPEAAMDALSNKLKGKLKSKNDIFSEGLVTAFLLFCMGSMTILGAIEEGLGGRPNLLLTKAIMDGFAAIALSSALGIGVMFSVIPLLVYQGGLTLLTALLGNYFSEIYINNLTSVGGILLIGLGIRILELKQIRVLNMLPALVIIVLLTWIKSIL